MNSVVYNFSYGANSHVNIRQSFILVFTYQKRKTYYFIHCQYISISNKPGNRLDIFLYIDSFNIHYKVKFNSIFQQWKFKLRKIFKCLILCC